ncbi:MAG: hypothetical protein ACI9UR_001659 [Bacteroidia bacterium]|jgi:hypothetical protein
MRNLTYSFFVASLLLVSQGISAQNVVPEGSTVIDLTLPESISQEAKKLKTLENAVLFKGTSKTDFQVYLKEGASLRDLEKELSSMFGKGVKAIPHKD